MRDRLSTLGLDAIAELTHFACTSEDINSDVLRAHRPARGQRVWLPKLRAVIAALRELAVAHRDAAMLSRTHGQPATPDDDGQGARGVRLAPRARRGADRGRPSTSRSSPERPAPGRRTSPPTPTSTGRRCPARSSRGSGIGFNVAHDPDRVPRLAGRAVRPRAARRRHPAQSRHRHVDLHLARLLLADPRRRGDRVVDDAAQDQPDPVRERRGEPRDLGRPARDARRRRS